MKKSITILLIGMMTINLMSSQNIVEQSKTDLRLVDGQLIRFYKGEKFNGIAFFTYENKKLWNYYSFEDGIKNGPWENYYSSGNLKIKGNFKNDKENGPYEMYYENKNLKFKAIYVNGKIHGEWKIYYENGQLKEKGTYKHGKKHGLCIKYNSNGQLKEKSTYKNGEKVN